MVTAAQIERLEKRIDAIVERYVPPEPPPEAWICDGDRCWPTGGSPEQAISFAELEARPTGRTQFPTRILHIAVHPDGKGGKAECCLPGGVCHELHGSADEPPRGR